MARAVELGVEGLGTTSPNPSVGCVLTDPTGTVIAEGRTEPPGGRHAEIVALHAAGPRATGATAYVTLEPCDHTGRTGPCTEALIAAGISRVVYANPDPTHGGAEALRAAGIETEHRPGAGYLTPWLRSTELQRPYVTWKVAATLDGRSAAPDGTSRWITGPEAREQVHLLRSQVDAVVVGSGTVLADDPELTDRRPRATHQPRRVVLDRRGRTPSGARVHPATVSSSPPAEALADLYADGARHLLLEGGPTLAGEFIGAGLVDEIHWYAAPLTLGAGLPALVTGATTLTDAQRWTVHDLSRVGADVRFVLRPA